MAIRGDSTEYNLLKEWCETLPFFEEPKSVTTCEIGIREGLGSKIIIAGIKKRIGFIPYKHIAIDPYGNLKYQHYDKGPAYTADYTDSMRLQMEQDFKDKLSSDPTLQAKVLDILKRVGTELGII